MVVSNGASVYLQSVLSDRT